MWKDGSLWLGRVFGAPVRWHWSTPVGAWFFARGELGGVVGFVVVVLVHELGHAGVVRRLGHEVLAVDVHGLGAPRTSSWPR